MSTINFHNCDNMEFMKNIPDKFYDLAIVDPPYRDTNQPTKDMRSNGSMKSLEGRPSKEYFNELLRVSKNQIVWGANNFELPQFKGFIVWNKGIPMDFTMSMAELASISEGLGTISKIFEFRIAGAESRIHPTQKPVKLYKWLLKNYATCSSCENKGWVYLTMGKQTDCPKCKGVIPKILDTHGGSMSIAIACHDLGFDLDLCELDKDYFNAGVKRFEQHKKQLKLL
jgi:site-specific DNA-methyltransferase (adenine-specific)